MEADTPLTQVNGTKPHSDETGAEKNTGLADDGAAVITNGDIKSVAKDEQDQARVKLRIPKTVCLYLCFLAAGFATNILGPTLVNMHVFLDTTLESIVSAFSGAIVGWIGGSVIAGVCYERFNPELQMAIASMVIFLTTAMAPWTGSLYGFIALMTVQGLGAGYIDAGGQPYGLRLWAGSKRKGPVMQATAVFTSIGSSVGPLIVSPFLINVEHLNKAANNSTTDSPVLSVDNTSLQNCTSQLCNTSIMTNSTPFNREDMMVGFAYVTLSCVMFLAMCAMSFLFLIGGPSCWTKAVAKTVAEVKEENHPEDLKFKLSIYALLFVFFVLLMWISGLGHLIPALVTEGLSWPVQHGSWIASLFWGMLGVGRVAGIFLSTKMSPAQMLFMDTSLAVFALGLMCLVTVTNDAIMWIAAALAGFATASEFVSAVLWASKYIKFTGATAAVCITGMGTGGIAGVEVAGYFFDKDMYLAVIYCSLAATILHLLLFIFMYVFAESYYKHLKARESKDKKEKEPLATEMKTVEPGKGPEKA